MSEGIRYNAIHYKNINNNKIKRRIEIVISENDIWLGAHKSKLLLWTKDLFSELAGHSYSTPEFYDYTYYFRWDDIKDVIINQQESYTGSTAILDLQIDKSGQRDLIRLQIKNIVEARTIQRVILDAIVRYNRKRELERLTKERYKVGNLDGITPAQFERLIYELFTCMGYSVFHIGGSGDQGIDLECRSKLNNKRIIVQCKRYKSKVSSSTIRDFYGALIHSKADKGYIITTGEFTKNGCEWSRDKPIELINNRRLKELLMQYYK